MHWLKAFHLIFIITWFAGLFYLPRLFVYHAMCDDEPGNARFKIMERKLYYGIMTPSAVLTVITGFWLINMNPLVLHAHWLQVKLFLVLLLLIFHFCCGHYYQQFKTNNNQHSHVFYRWFNEIPSVLLIAIIILAMVHPF